MIPGDVEAQKMNKSFPCGSSLRVSNLLHLLQCQTSLNAPAFMQHLLPLWPFFLSRLISPLSGPAQYILPHNCLHPTSIFHSLKKSDLVVSCSKPRVLGSGSGQEMSDTGGLSSLLSFTLSFQLSYHWFRLFPSLQRSAPPSPLSHLT